MANIVKSEGNPVVDALLAGIDPEGLAKNFASFSVGFGSAMLGGRLAKQIDAVEQFAAGGILQEILVDALAGLALDVVPLAALYMATKEEHGPDMVIKVAKMMVAGTLLGAIIPNAAQHITDAIDKGVDLIVGVFGLTPKASVGESQQDELKRLGERAAQPGGGGMGIYASAPGGSLYSLSAM